MSKEPQQPKTEAIYIEDDLALATSGVKTLKKNGVRAVVIHNTHELKDQGPSAILDQIRQFRPRLVLIDFHGPIPAPEIIKVVIQAPELSILRRTDMTKGPLQPGLWIVVTSMDAGRGNLSAEIKPAVSAFIGKGVLWKPKTLQEITNLIQAQTQEAALAALQALESDRAYQG